MKLGIKGLEADQPTGKPLDSGSLTLETVPVAPNDSDPEREIVQAVCAVRAGDVQAYAAIVNRFQASIMTLCVAILRDPQAAEELAQDVFVRAYQRLDTFDVRRPMKPWLVKIAYRLAQKVAHSVRQTAREQQPRRCSSRTAAKEPTERLSR